MMRFSLCNEVLRELPFARQCAMARALGYAGLEIAPFTLGAEPHRLPASAVAELRRAADAEGIAITGLHWLLLTPEGLSITSEDAAVRARTLDVMRGLIELCAALGGGHLVHGSPNQRRLEQGRENVQRGLAAEMFAEAGRHAAGAGVVYCVEPLDPAQINYLTSVAEAAELVRAIGEPALATMIDVSASVRGGEGDAAALIARWLPSGLIAHIHLNDPNRRAPGQGDLDFRPILAAVRAGGYRGVLGVEPFVYEPDGPTTAARAIGYLEGCAEGL